MSLVDGSIKYPVSVAVGVMIAVLGGLLALNAVPIQLTPEISKPMVHVSTFWPGASPEEVEKEIVEEQEDYLKRVQGVLRMRSQSRDSMGIISLEFAPGTDLTGATVRVSNKLDEVRSYPDNADRPVVSTVGERKLVLFFTGREHAGENLQKVLEQREAELSAPIQMCDALSRNMPAELNTILSNCLVHGRRNFVDVAEHFPQECRHVLKALKVVYKNDADAREQNLSPEARLQFHQANSGPVMEALHEWLTRQIDDRLVEPNSGLGQAIAYMLKHWPELTLFLRQAGAPLDNNLCERALKKAILHRKNALFYKTDNGARVGDIYMSLIHTCELCHANPLDYLTELLRHPDEVSASPESWMPWNYRRALDGLTVSASPETTR